MLAAIAAPALGGSGPLRLAPAAGGDDAPRLAAAVADAARRGEALRLAPGDYLLRSPALEVEGLGTVRLEGRGAALVDLGREVSRGEGRRRLPWGIAFARCRSVTIEGVRFETRGPGLGGASGGFAAGDAALRRPVLGFASCAEVALRGVVLAGNPGAGVVPDDFDPGWHAALAPVQVAALALSHAFVRFLSCADVAVEDAALAPDACAREIWGAVGCGRVRLLRLSSHSRGANFASLAKLILCGEVECRDFAVTDASDASLVDMIARRFHVAGFRLDLPRGKLLDVSHEWRRANGPIEAGLVEDCRTTGSGIVNARVRSTEEQVAPFPIGEVRVRGLSCGPGGAEGHRWINLRRFRRLLVEDSEGVDVAMGRGVEVRPGAEGRVELLRCAFRWTRPVAAPSRAFAAGALRMRECRFRAAPEASPVAFLRPADGEEMALEECDAEGVAFEALGALALRGGRFRDCGFRLGPRAVVTLAGCVLEAAPGSGPLFTGAGRIVLEGATLRLTAPGPAPALVAPGGPQPGGAGRLRVLDAQGRPLAH